MTTANPPDEPVVRVTLTKIYEVVLDVQNRVSDLTTQRLNDVEDIRDLKSELRESKAELKRRVSALEERRWPLSQIMALTAVAGVVLTVAGIVITLAVKTL